MRVRVGKWAKGMDNILPEFEIPEDTLRDCVNMDVGDSGRLRPRTGRRKIYSGVISPRTLGGDGRGLTLFVENGDLKCLRQVGDTYIGEIIRAGVGSYPMAYAFVNNTAYFTNTRVNGAVVNRGHEPLVMPVPMSDPGLQATTGHLPAGAYHVALTFCDLKSESESGAIESFSITVPENGGIVLGTPPTPPLGSLLRVYVTSPDGEVPREQYHWNPIITLDKGPALQTQFLDPLPAGQAIAHYNGRVYVARDNVVWYSEPWAPGLCNMEDNHFVYPEDVTVMVDVIDKPGGEGGIYVCSDRTYFISGAAKPSSREIETFPHRGVKHTAIKHPDNTSAAWVTSKGIAVGDATGSVDLLTEDKIAHPGYEAGALLYREHQGRHQYIATLTGGSPSARATEQWS